MRLMQRRLLAALAALLAFSLSALLLVVALPVLFGLLYGCVPPTGSCGDGVGWAMVISSPIMVPLGLMTAVACAVAAYLRVSRPPI